MGLAVYKSKGHPYINRKKGVCGGKSIIKGTRIPVWSIIKWYKLGMSIEEIMREFPQLMSRTSRIPQVGPKEFPN